MDTLTDWAKARSVTTDWTTHGYHLDEDGWEHQRWTFTLTLDGRELIVPFRTGTAWEEVPSAAVVLSAIRSDAEAGVEDFEEFCANFGYDTDSRKAYATWEECREAGRKLDEWIVSDEDRLAFDQAEGE